jgi:NAD-dependent DNA ligase
LITTREQYAAAVVDVHNAAHAYYTSGTSPLDDASYDALARAVAVCEQEHPDWVNAASGGGRATEPCRTVSAFPQVRMGAIQGLSESLAYVPVRM